MVEHNESFHKTSFDVRLSELMSRVRGQRQYHRGRQVAAHQLAEEALMRKSGRESIEQAYSASTIELDALKRGGIYRRAENRLRSVANKARVNQ